MYIRRKVFSIATDIETGEERYFSTNEIMSDEQYQKEFGITSTGQALSCTDPKVKALAKQMKEAGYKGNAVKKAWETIANETDADVVNKQAKRQAERQAAKNAVKGQPKVTGAARGTLAKEAATKAGNNFKPVAQASDFAAQNNVESRRAARIAEQKGKTLMGKAAKFVKNNKKALMIGGGIAAVGGTGAVAHRMVANKRDDE